MLRIAVCVWTLCVCVRAAGGDCEVVGEGGATYMREELVRAGWTYGLIVNWNTNILYYSYYESSTIRRVVKALDLGNKTTAVVGPAENCRVAVDQRRSHVYMGCNNDTRQGGGGLYQWDSNVGRFVVVGAEGENVVNVHYAENRLYYITHPTYRLRVYAHGKTHPVEELGEAEVMGMVIGGAGEWVFYNNTGLWRRARGDGEVRQFMGVDGSYVELAVSPLGDVLVTYYDSTNQTHSLYEALPDASLRRRLELPLSTSGLAVDAQGTLIYGDYSNGTIVRLNEC